LSFNGEKSCILFSIKFFWNYNSFSHYFG
jgi:hypothetical protein